MNRRLFGAFGVLAVAALFVGACKSDPLSDLDGKPADVVTDFSSLQLQPGNTAAITAQVVDGRFVPLATPITFRACTGDVVVVADTSYHPIPATSARAVVTAVTANPSCVEVRGGGLVDSVTVAVLPLTFLGTLSGTTFVAGDTLTLTSTNVLKFDTATVAVTFGGGALGFIVSKTPDVVKLLVPFSTPAPLSIAGINVTYVPGLITTLQTSDTVTQTGDQFVNSDTGYASAPTIAIPAAGETVKFLTNFGVANGPRCAEFGPPAPANSIGPCVIYKFTLAAPTALTFTTSWPTTGDMDTYICGAAGLSACFEGGGSGAGASNPEIISSFSYPAGTHYFVIEQFRGPQPTNLYVTITQP
jgi:hypothetical protein